MLIIIHVNILTLGHYTRVSYFFFSFPCIYSNNYRIISDDNQVE